VTGGYLSTHGDDRYRVSHYDIELEYRPNPARLTGRAVVSAVAVRVLSEIRLDLHRLRAEWVRVDGAPARYAQREGKLTIRPTRPVPAGGAFAVTVGYAGRPRPINSLWGDIGWEELTDGVIVASQPTGAPSWFPCNDRPGDKASYRIAVRAPARYTVVANGTLAARHIDGATAAWEYDQPVPMSTYLATVHIGRYVPVDLADGPVPQRAWVPNRLLPRFRHDFARQPEMMSLFTRLFGPYPFAGYGVVVVGDELDVPLEAHGLSTFGANHVDGRRGSERLVAHELAHQWFGNSLTVSDWRDIWLHEGFAKYAEWLWFEHSGGGPAPVHAARAWSLVASMPQDLTLADPGVRRMFDDRVYERGALTVHALRTVLGDAAFFDLLREWTTEYRNRTVTTEAFEAMARRHAPHPLDYLFRAWLREQPLPPLPS
jgi:aminopeptidase N